MDTAVLEPEVRYVTEKDKPVLPTTKIGGLEFPADSEEAKQCQNIRGILEDYALRDDATRPLSIAVFGPPGSGKSRCVKEIVKSLGGKDTAGKFAALIPINLSQLSRTDALAKTVVDAIEERKRTPDGLIPIFFFDEFDASLPGEGGSLPITLGWLRWFLAPMQDGEITYNGGTTLLARAVFMFAGGTAASLAEFEERAKLDPAFREKKVPDFISRLRGFIDIQGVNNREKEQELKVRRALVLRYLLDKRWPRRFESENFSISHDRVRSLLSSVHFIHGVRSMEALMDMSTLKDGKVQLPENKLKELHVSRGSLGGKLVGVSAGLEEPVYILDEVTRELLHNGAKLAYGGDFTPTGTLDRIAHAEQSVPSDFFGENKKRIKNYLGFPSCYRDVVVKAKELNKETIEFVELETLSRQEIRELNLNEKEWFPARPLKEGETYRTNQHLAWAISLFRMRVRMIQDVDALIVFGGKDGESWGRFSGVAEEVMLALAFEKPIYVLGGRGGAAGAVGRLLGLDNTIANPDECLNDVESMVAACPPKFRRAFALPNHQLPETIEEMRNYFFARSAATKAWPWNGLSFAENRELFCAKIDSEADTRECVRLIVKGLNRLGWKEPASRQPH